LNFSLLFHTSLDESFDTIEKRNVINSTSLRVSLLCFPVGSKIIYLLTFNKKSKRILDKSNFHFFTSIHYDTLCPRISGAKIEEYVMAYSQYIKSILPKRRKEQEDFLKQRLSENNDSLSNLQSKITHYTTITIALTGAVVYLQTILPSANTNFAIRFISYYLFFILLVNIINLFLFLRKGMMVSSFSQSSFKSLKFDNSNYALTKAIYRDWIARKDDVRYFAGIVRNAEKYLYRSILVGITLYMFSISLQYYSDNPVNEIIFTPSGMFLAVN
ncbi:TPA: hypothetical protein ACXGT9_005045, partial [Escherichia coli]|nr:hypothetical protein [Escherichia coli]EMC8412205.1 hypothetical protein [Escherichia coli]